MELNRYLLTECGILPENLDIIDKCTCCEPEVFFSHRYSGGLRGTMLNVIFMQNRQINTIVNECI